VLKPAEGGRVSRFSSSNPARASHEGTGRVARLGTRREKDSRDTWQIVIGPADFYLILSLNLIISLQIIFYFLYFYTKIHDFFSL
jgi:hypothetical protein